jgi:hypothetical protein
MAEPTLWSHRGALAAVFADGALGWEYPGIDVFVRRVKGQTLPREEGFLRPASDIVGWLQWCECGWQFRPWIRVDDPAAQDVGARHVYSRYSSPPLDTIGAATDDEWLAHLPHNDDAASGSPDTA